MPYTKEQKRIIRDINEGKNVRVVAVAGSGKTSTILGTVGEHEATLVLCYNNRLRAETIERIKSITDELSAPFDVHTFHSFVYTTFDEPMATTDIGIVRINNILNPIVLNSDKSHKPRKDIIPKMRELFREESLRKLIGAGRYRRIIVDEAQDLTPEYFALSRNLMCITGASIILLGDPRQAIYQFNGATDKYLRNAHLHYGREFVDRQLSVSFRVPEMVAKMINASTSASDDKLAVDIIPATKSTIRPMIYIDDMMSKIDILVDMIKKVSPKDVMILMYSTRRDEYRPSVKIANALSAAGIPICFNGIGEDSENGVLMISYHQSKGLERPIVICVDLGEYYFAINPDVRKDVLPNLWYVAMTRASKFLVAFIDKPFAFITKGLEAIGFNPPMGVLVDVDDGDVSKTNEKTDDDRPVTNDEILRYTSGGFEKLVKYTPTRVQMAIMNDYPEIFTSIGSQQITTNPSDHCNHLLQEYVRTSIISLKPLPEHEYMVTFRKAILGALRGVSLDLGKIMMGSQEISVEYAMELCYNVAIHILSSLNLVSFYGTRGEFGNVDAAGKLFIDEKMEVIIIITTGPSIETRLRVASFGEKPIVIIDILAGTYAKKGW